MKLLVLAGIYVFTSALCFAQAPNWTPATIYLQEGDTIIGIIDFQDWNISPTSISVVQDGKTITYAGTKVKGFTTGGRRYTLIQTDLKYYHEAPIKQSTSPVAREEPVSVFAEVLYASHGLELYSLMDDKEDERLFILKDGIVRELVRFQIAIEVNGRTTAQTSNIFRSTLQVLLTDCGVAVSPNLQYSAKAIVPLLKSYSKCKGHEVELESKERKALVQLGASGGGIFVYDKEEGNGGIGFYAIDAQLLTERRHNNTFIWVTAGIPAVPREERDKVFLLGFRGGSYFGSGKVQSLAHFGISNALGVNAGGGVAYNKSIILVGSYRFLSAISSVGKTHQVSVELRFFPRLKPAAK